MELIDAVRPFLSFIDEYDHTFYERNIDKFQLLHVRDNGVVFFDNHADCDSSTYKEHEASVASYFRSGEIGTLVREKFRVFVADDWLLAERGVGSGRQFRSNG